MKILQFCHININISVSFGECYLSSLQIHDSTQKVQLAVELEFQGHLFLVCVLLSVHPQWSLFAKCDSTGLLVNVRICLLRSKKDDIFYGQFTLTFNQSHLARYIYRPTPTFCYREVQVSFMKFVESHSGKCRKQRCTYSYT